MDSNEYKQQVQAQLEALKQPVEIAQRMKAAGFSEEEDAATLYEFERLKLELDKSDPQPAPADAPRDSARYAAHDWSEDGPLENGQYFNTCAECKVQFVGHKRRLLCKACAFVADAKPADDLEELGRLAKEAVSQGPWMYEPEREFAEAQVVDEHGDLVTAWVKNLQYLAACSPDRIQALIERVQKAEAERFNPLGDNHHNALKCPYCSFGYREMEARAEAAEQSLQAERDKVARLEAEIAELKAGHAAATADTEKRIAEVMAMAEGMKAVKDDMIARQKGLAELQLQAIEEQSVVIAAMAERLREAQPFIKAYHAGMRWHETSGAAAWLAWFASSGLAQSDMQEVGE